MIYVTIIYEYVLNIVKAANNKQHHLYHRLKSFRLHETMAGLTKSADIASFVDIDLTWKRSDEDKDTALPTKYLDQIGLGNLTE